MKILLSGGHLTPAIAFIEHVKAHHPDDEIVFMGRLYSQDRLKQKSREHEEVTQRGVSFIPFFAPRVHSGSIVDKLVYILALVPACWQALWLVKKQAPTVFLSFGSYQAIPLALACAWWRIPIVTHEQTRTVGEATKFIAKMAHTVALSHASSQDDLNHSRTVITGNPLRSQLFKAQPTPAWITHHPDKPILYITGGNQGSEIINLMVKQALKPLARQWLVIHQCGGATVKRNYLKELTKAKGQLSQALQDSYEVKEWLSETELAWVYHHAAVVLSRSGANTVQELAALEIPSVLIPLPFAHHDEQTLNARYLADAGGALLLPQKELNPTSLIEQVEKAKKFSRSMKQKLKTLAMPKDAEVRLYQAVAQAAG